VKPRTTQKLLPAAALLWVEAVHPPPLICITTFVSSRNALLLDPCEPMLIDTRPTDLPEWLHELYPFRTRTFQAGPYRMSFVDEGEPEAPPLLLLHGNPTWSFLYRNLIRRARDRFRVIAPDNIGFGLSDKPAETGSPASAVFARAAKGASYHTLKRHIANLTGLIEALQLRDLTMVVNGWGGPIGMGYAVTHPANIARMVLTNTCGANLPNVHRLKLPLGARLAAAGRLGAWLDSLLNLTMHSAFSSRAHRTMGDLALEAYTFPFRTAPQVSAENRGANLGRHARAAIGSFRSMFFAPDAATLAKLDEIYAGLKNIQAPVKILWGAADPLLTKLPAYLLRDALKGASEPVFLPDIGHYVPEEAPDVLAEAVLQESKPAPSAGSTSVFKIIG
jgi:pimeloyl-ACP methyl ester carboxylesterase